MTAPSTFRNRFGLVASVLALTLVFAATADAQIGRSGVIGTAVDDDGKPIGGLEITMSPAGETAGRVQALKTDGRGRFANRFLASGMYIINVKDEENYFIRSADVQVKDAGGILLNEYQIVNHPQRGMTPIPIKGGEITDIKLVVTTADVRRKLIRQLEGSAMSEEMTELVRLYNAGELEAALTLGRELMEATTTEIPEVIHLVGMTYARMKRFDEAEPMLRHAIQLAPDQTEFSASLGTMLLEKARAVARDNQDAKSAYNEAQLWLGKAVETMKPTPVALLTNYSIALEGAGDTNAALKVMERIASEDPSNAIVRLRMAALLRTMGQPEKALEVLNTLPGGGDPRAVDSLYNVALTFYNDEDYESALAALKRAEELDAGHSATQRLLARVYYISGDYRSSLQHLRRFLELEPNHPEAKEEREMVTYLEKTLAQKRR